MSKVRLIAEVETDTGEHVQISCLDGNLLIERRDMTLFGFDIADFRAALDAVAGPVKPPTKLPPTIPYPALALSYRDEPDPAPNPYARNPDGSRNGPSPRDNMRARKPEANVEPIDDETPQVA